MKKKLLLFLMLFAAMAYEASAITIIIQGGSRSNKYHYVRLNNTVLVCKGRGPNSCPPWSSSGSETSVWHTSDQIEDFVFSQIEGGQTEGSANFENDLQIRWKPVEDGCVQIDVDAKEVKGLENYENPN